MFIIIFAISLHALGEFGIEAVLNVEIEDVKMIVDPKYFDPNNSGVKLVEDAETGEPAVDSWVTIINEVPIESEASLKITGMAMGKYSIPTGVGHNFPMCSSYNEPMIILPVLILHGIPTDTCPPPLGYYHQEGFKVMVNNLPDDATETKYLIEANVRYLEKVILQVTLYVDVRVE